MTLKLNRNPVLAGLAACVVFLSGCGAATQGYAPQGYMAKQGYAQAYGKRSKKGDKVAPSANKDWKFVEGEVSKLLPDDLNGSKHQHFLVKVSPKLTVKVAHNIDLAPYVPVEVGDSVKIKCEYIKTQPFDVAHWTHYDPRGGEGGYIEHEGKVYDRLER